MRLNASSDAPTTGLWCNGSTTDFDSVGMGSNPVSPARA